MTTIKIDRDFDITFADSKIVIEIPLGTTKIKLEENGVTIIKDETKFAQRGNKDD